MSQGSKLSLVLRTSQCTKEKILRKKVHTQIRVPQDLPHWLLRTYVNEGECEHLWVEPQGCVLARNPLTHITDLRRSIRPNLLHLRESKVSRKWKQTGHEQVKGSVCFLEAVPWNQLAQTSRSLVVGPKINWFATEAANNHSQHQNDPKCTKFIPILNFIMGLKWIECVLAWSCCMWGEHGFQELFGLVHMSWHVKKMRSWPVAVHCHPMSSPSPFYELSEKTGNFPAEQKKVSMDLDSLTTR
jgi:hypothetical protein